MGYCKESVTLSSFPKMMMYFPVIPSHGQEVQKLPSLLQVADLKGHISNAQIIKFQHQLYMVQKMLLERMHLTGDMVRGLDTYTCLR